MADLEAHAQVIGAIVEQQDGEDAVINNRAHQLGRLVHEGLEVTGRVQRIGQPHEELDLDRVFTHACLRGRLF